VKIGAKHIRVGRKDDRMIIDDELSESVKEDATLWTIDGTEVIIELEKVGSFTLFVHDSFDFIYRLVGWDVVVEPAAGG